MITQKELNLRQRRWLELLKHYDISVLYHPDKVNVVVDALSCMTVGGVSHRLARLGVRLEDFSDGGFMVHHNSESYLVVEVKSKQHVDQPLMKFKELVLSKLNDSFFLRGILYCGTKGDCVFPTYMG